MTITKEEKKETLNIFDKVFINADPRIRFNYKILLLGSTGAGKTSFLNLLNNVTHATRDIKNIETCKKFNKKFPIL